MSFFDLPAQLKILIDRFLPGLLSIFTGPGCGNTLSGFSCLSCDIFDVIRERFCLIGDPCLDQKSRLADILKVRLCCL